MSRVIVEDIIIRPLTDTDRAAIAAWRYPGDLAIYSPGRDAFDLVEPDHVALVSTGDSTDGALLGYGTLGDEAQVPGGRYDGADLVVDLGLGLHPDRVGAGYGGRALLALIAHARERFGATGLRATVAAPNHRATRLVEGLGFRPTHRFRRARDGREFVQYERQPVR